MGKTTAGGVKRKAADVANPQKLKKKLKSEKAVQSRAVSSAGDDLEDNFAYEAVVAESDSDSAEGGNVAADRGDGEDGSVASEIEPKWPVGGTASAKPSGKIDLDKGSDDGSDSDDDEESKAKRAARKERRRDKRKAKALAAAAAAREGVEEEEAAAAGTDPVAAAAAKSVAGIADRPTCTFSGACAIPYAPTAAAQAAALWKAYSRSPVGSMLSPLELGEPLTGAQIACPHENIARDAVALAAAGAVVAPARGAAAKAGEPAPVPALPQGLSKRQLKKLKRKQTQLEAAAGGAGAAPAPKGDGDDSDDGNNDKSAPAVAPSVSASAARAPTAVAPYTLSYSADGSDLPAFIKRALPTWRRAVAFKAGPGGGDKAKAAAPAEPGAAAADAKGKEKGKAGGEPKPLGPPASPSILIICPSALRCVGLLKSLSSFSCRVAKCFARHTTLEEAAQQLRSGPHAAIAVGTPARFAKLFEAGHLTLDAACLVLLDVHPDAKTFSLLDHPDAGVGKEAWALIREHVLPRARLATGPGSAAPGAPATKIAIY